MLDGVGGVSQCLNGERHNDHGTSKNVAHSPSIQNEFLHFCQETLMKM
jgi:hypothetical protein